MESNKVALAREQIQVHNPFVIIFEVSCLKHPPNDWKKKMKKKKQPFFMANAWINKNNILFHFQHCVSPPHTKVISELSVHQPSKPAVSDQDIVKCNKMAVQKK
jgi:hypothetical protein